MQTASFIIWTAAGSIHHDDNRYNMSASQHICM